LARAQESNRQYYLFSPLDLISLFTKITYEGARSINGQYLGLLGMSGKNVGQVAGLVGLFGYSLQVLSGYLIDKTRKYWTVLIIGYLINLVSVPSLGFAGYWQLAFILVVIERIGKSIRTPAREAILSFGRTEMGRGLGFGLHKALDQIGGLVGPLLVTTLLLHRNHSFQSAYWGLIISRFICNHHYVFCSLKIFYNCATGNHLRSYSYQRLFKTFLDLSFSWSIYFS
jgi:hypothetical protein